VPRGDIEISRLLSLVLRHDPGRVGLELDLAGWVEVSELIEAVQACGLDLDLETLRRVVADNDKQRFAISSDGRRIRANQGHSVEVDLGLESRAPPALLFHGTATRFVASIRRDGLHAASRQHVHLSADAVTALAVGRRHGRPVVLTVRSGEMYAAGQRFFRADNRVWLTAQVASRWIEYPAVTVP
jgi:putative RNA 2'-phosphotransferase